MKKYLITLFTLLVLLAAGFTAWWFYKQPPQPQPIKLMPRSFAELPGWRSTSVLKSLEAFQISCKAFLKQDPEKPVGSTKIELKAGDWHPSCRQALSISPLTEQKARDFFQTWFSPVEFNDNKPVQGLFTGYYMAYLHGSMKKTDKYKIPVYGMPSDLVTVNLEKFDPTLKHRRLAGRIEGNQLLPYYTRAEINRGAIKGKARVLLWVDNPIDRLFMEIQGSGTIELPDGNMVYLGYAAQNGASYTPIARVLIDKGVMTKDNASMQHIKSYLEAHPQEMNKVLNKNKSFVFFHFLKNNSAMGAQGVPLTAGYSLAIDRQWIPIGAPLWLSTSRPTKIVDKDKPFQRLMIAQDTGGAIRGVVRGDVYWGAGDNATFIAGHMKNPGHYWLLLPKHTLERLAKAFS